MTGPSARAPEGTLPAGGVPSVRPGGAATGTVLRSQGGVYEVETPAGVIRAALRGRLKRDERSGDRVVVGDLVDVAADAAGTGEAWAIEAVHDRRTVLARKAPGKAPRRKVIVANVDQLLVVFAAAEPAPHLRMLDRFLVIAEAEELRPVVIVNKVDLTGEEVARALFGAYERIGYEVRYVAARAGLGVDGVREALCGRLSALTGPSGVGKSSLLNAVQPGLSLRVGDVSAAVHKGQHTTVTAELIPLACGGYVADTPGLRELGLWGIDPEELRFLFREFPAVADGCRYPGCTHVHEPGCAVRDAAGSGEIAPARYDSYLRMMAGDDE